MISDYVTIREALQFCPYSEKRIREAIDAGKIPFELMADKEKRYKSGRQLVVHIRLDHLEGWIASRKGDPEPSASDLLTIREAVKRYGISERRVRYAIIDGDLSFELRPDRDRKWGNGNKPIKHLRVEDIEAWLEREKIAPKAQ